MNLLSRKFIIPTIILTLSIVSPALAQTEPVIDKADTSWMLISTALVLMMTIPGVALFYGGMVKKDNVLAVLMQSFTVTCLVGVLWPVIAYSLVFTQGSTGFIGGTSRAMLNGMGLSTLSATIPESVMVMYQFTFAAITCALLIGSVADRLKFTALLLFAPLWVVFVYSPVAHWVWGPGGMLGGIGIENFTGLLGFGAALDFAGGTVVHINSGVAGLVAALYIGKRIDFGKAQHIPHNLVLSMIGASLLWVGWFGFNAGSAVASNDRAGMAMLVTNTASAVAALTWIIIELAHRGKASVLGGMSGAVAGLVAITPGSGFVNFAGSLVIGIAGSAACYWAVTYLKNRFKYDDSLDVFGIHGMGGFVGAILTGVFATSSIGGVSGLIEGNSNQVVAQVIAVVITAVYSGLVTYVLLKVVDMTIGLRVDKETEVSGLDLAMHGEKVVG